MKLYVASSWRNKYQPRVVELAKGLGIDVYDFRNPPGRTGFAWSDIDPKWQEWTTEGYIKALGHPLAIAGFASDMEALRLADATLLVGPCGRSAHLELGYAVGANQATAVYLPERQEPELMYLMTDTVLASEEEMISWLRNLLVS